MGYWRSISRAGRGLKLYPRNGLTIRICIDRPCDTRSRGCLSDYNRAVVLGTVARKEVMEHMRYFSIHATVIQAMGGSPDCSVRFATLIQRARESFSENS